jgi:hypothetical protein
MRLHKIRESAGLLLAALDTREQRVILEAQQNFSKAVEAAWQAYQQGEIETQVGAQTLPRSMYPVCNQGTAPGSGSPAPLVDGRAGIDQFCADHGSGPTSH